MAGFPITGKCAEIGQVSERLPVPSPCLLTWLNHKGPGRSKKLRLTFSNPATAAKLPRMMGQNRQSKHGDCDDGHLDRFLLSSSFHLAQLERPGRLGRR